MSKASKTADAARAAYKAKKAAPKGGGKSASGSKLYTPVKQSTINKIKEAGMTASLKKAATSKDMEFVAGVRRMYGANRLSAAKKAAGSVAKSPDAARAAAARNKPAAKSADAAREKYIGTGPNKAKMTTINKMGPKKYTSKSPKPLNPKGLFPGLLGGKKK